MKILKKINPKYRLFVLSGLIIISFTLLIALASLMKGTTYTYAQVEQKLRSSAQNYYKNRPNELPKEDGNKVTITDQKLVESGNLKSLNKLIQNETCTGSVSVINNNGFYLYTPYLSCGESYQTKTLYSTITDTTKIVTAGNGLYQYGDEFVFRGEYVNNYVTFAGKSWRIIKINSDHSLRLIHITKEDGVIWDNRYNSETKTSEGINNYLVSRIRDRVNNRYNDNNFFNDTNRSYIVSHDVCIGKRTSKDDNSVECSEILEKQPLSLPRSSELMLASIDPQCTSITSRNCTNYNWFTEIPRSWTVTADSESTNRVFRINGIASKTQTDSTSKMSIVLHLSGDLSYTSGDGSSQKPYIIK